MELESLKYAWKTFDNLSATQKKRPDTREQEQQLLALLHKRSRGLVARIRRNLVLELAGVIGLYTPAIAWYLFRFGGRLSAISWFVLVMAGLFGIYYYRMNRILKEMQRPAFRVKSNLERQVRSLGKYIRAYLVMGTLLIPMTACLLGILLYWKLPPPLHPGILYVSADNPLWKVVLLWVTGLCTSAVGMYFINKWRTYSLYGRHIDSLREVLREISAA
jgi:hypothetical protein